MSAIGLPQLYATLSPQKITGVTGTTLTIPGGYTAPYIIIGKNGSLLDPAAYTATNGTSVTLNTAAISSDEFAVFAFGTFNIASPQFIDSGFQIYGSSDATKKVAFEVDGLTTGTTRTIAVPDASGTMALISSGSWTGTLKGAGADPTVPVTANGTYIKIGKLVVASIDFSNVSTVGASGTPSISGLPFQASNEANGSAAVFSMFTMTQPSLTCSVSPGSSIVNFICSGTAAAWASPSHNAGTGRYLRATISYETNS